MWLLPHSSRPSCIFSQPVIVMVSDFPLHNNG
jgi:hypothetical protein